MNAAYEKVGDFNHAGDLERKFSSIATDTRLGERALLQINADWYRKSVVSDPTNPTLPVACPPQQHGAGCGRAATFCHRQTPG